MKRNIRLTTITDSVGIGTLNPETKLHINVSDNNNNHLRIFRNPNLPGIGKSWYLRDCHLS